jgi:hypothetical protein
MKKHERSAKKIRNFAFIWKPPEKNPFQLSINNKVMNILNEYIGVKDKIRYLSLLFVYSVMSSLT